MPGFAFSLAVGKAAPDVFRRLCTVRGTDRLLFVSAKLEHFLLEAAVEMFNAQSTAPAVPSMAPTHQ